MAKVFVPVSYAGIKFSAETIQGSRARRITEHQAYGRSGADTEDTGRNAYRDQIAARLDLATYKRLMNVINQGKVRTFTHPVFGTYKARVHVVTDSMGASRTAGAINFQAEVIEDVSQPLSTKADATPRTYRNRAQAWYDEAAENWPAELNETGAFIEIGDDFNSAFDDLINEVDLYMAGGATVDGLARAMSGMESASGAAISALHTQAEYLEGSYATVTSVYNLVGAAQDLVDVVAQTAADHTARVMDGPMDVYTLAINLYGDAGKAAQIIAQNNLLDPFWIPAGTEVVLPFNI